MLDITNHQRKITKTTMRYHLIPVRMDKLLENPKMSVGEDVEKQEPLCTVGGNANWGNHHGKQCGRSSVLFLGLFFFFCFWLQSMWDLSSLTRDQTHILCTESLESQPLDCQGSPLFLGLYPKELKSGSLRDTYPPSMFTAALFTIVRIRKQPQCPSMDEWAV